MSAKPLETDRQMIDSNSEGEMLDIRETTEAHEPAIHEVHYAAFGEKEGRVIANLTIELLHDPTAEPCLSILATDGETAVGHVLFTAVRISDSPSTRAHILAPLAVLPGKQRQGVGTAIVERGLELLKERGTQLVFVLGHPSYYPRFGFQPAGRLGLSAPYPIPEKDSDAWMVLELSEGMLGSIKGTIQCAAALDAEEHWRE